MYLCVHVSISLSVIVGSIGSSKRHSSVGVWSQHVHVCVTYSIVSSHCCCQFSHLWNGDMLKTFGQSPLPTSAVKSQDHRLLFAVCSTLNYGINFLVLFVFCISQLCHRALLQSDSGPVVYVSYGVMHSRLKTPFLKDFSSVAFLGIWWNTEQLVFGSLVVVLFWMWQISRPSWLLSALQNINFYLLIYLFFVLIYTCVTQDTLDTSKHKITEHVDSTLCSVSTVCIHRLFYPTFLIMIAY